ncbi:MAG: serine hydrolase [Bacteroidota bacterium]
MKITVLCVFLALFSLTTLSAQILTKGYLAAANIDSVKLTSDLVNIMSEGIAAEAFPGANILVAQDGQIVLHETYGHWTYDKVREVQKDDIYDYASVTKITSALAAVMKLYGEGRFDLDAELKDYLPNMRWSNKAKMTFREMLAHQAQLKPGIVHWQRTLKKDGDFKARTFQRDSSTRFPIKITDDLWLHRHYQKKMMKAIKKSDLLEKEGYRYSGLLFYLLPQIIENITGEDYEAYLKREIYQKIDATTITFNPLQYFPIDRIVPTERDTFFRKLQVHGFVHDEGAGMMGGISANAGLFSTTEDLAKMAQLYLNQGKYGDEQLIAPGALAVFTSYQYPNNRRGLGFDKPNLEKDGSHYIAESASPMSFGHSGYTGTFVWIDPVYNLIVVFCSNRVYPDRSHRQLYELNIRPRLHQAIYDALPEYLPVPTK